MPLPQSFVPFLVVLASALSAGVAGGSTLTADQATATAEIQDLTFSADGAALALTLVGPPDVAGSPRRIWLYRVADGQLGPFTQSAKSERLPRFSPDGRQLAFLSDREGDDQIYLLPIDGGEARRLTHGVGAVSQLKWSPDGQNIAFLAQRAQTAEEEARSTSRDDARVYEKDDRFPQVYTVEVATGETTLHLAAPWRANDLVWAPRGGRLFVAATEDESAPLLRYSVLALDLSAPATTSLPTPLAQIAGPIGQLGISPDGAWLSYLGCRERGPSKHDLFLIPTAGGAPRNLSARQVDHALESYGWRPDGRLVASAMFGFRSRLLEIGLDGAAKTLLSPEMAFDSIAVSPRGPVAFVGSQAIRPPELFFADLQGEIRRLSDFHSDFAGYSLSQPTFITYPSFDGLAIEAMVLAPPGVVTPRKLPTVVIPHGGPAWRFADSFLPLAQLLATTGHLVLLPNIRGSQGRSYEFMTLARNDWGGGDFRDLLAGVDHLIAQGQADPDRLAIAGWSYGGYMAAWAVTQTNRFQAAVAGAGLFNLISEFGTEIQPSYDEWYFGLPWENPQLYLERSPLTHVARAKTPTLLLHGAEDLIDPLSQSLELYRAFKHYGVPTELVIYPREGHTLRERAHVRDRHQRSLDWLRKYLGTAEPPATEAVAAATTSQGEDWLRWGGPRGDFTVEASALAEQWPASGPPRLWQRPLGGGYSSILYRGGRLFTLYQEGDEDVLVALDAATGATLWENRDTYSLWPEMDRGFGLGPNSTPLVLDELVVGIGISGRLRAVAADTGQTVWSRDLPREFGRRPRVEEYGYSANPLPYGRTLLTLVGSDTAAVFALDQQDGSVVWKSAPGGVSYAQPTLTHLAGRDQFIYFEPEGVVALDPATGATLWKHPIEFRNGNHLTPATRCDDHHLWVSSQFDSGGGRMLSVKAAGDQMVVEELWFTPKLRASHWTLHCRGDFLYGSIGGNDTSRLAAVRWKDGEIAWQQEGFHKALALWADGKLLFLDQNGQLVLARVSPERFELLAQAAVAKPQAWSLPTLVGTTLYVRDQEKIMALDLAARPAGAGDAQPAAKPADLAVAPCNAPTTIHQFFERTLSAKP